MSAEEQLILLNEKVRKLEEMVERQQHVIDRGAIGHDRVLASGGGRSSRIPTKAGGSQLGCGQAVDKRGFQRTWPIRLFGCASFSRAKEVFLSDNLGLYSLKPSRTHEDPRQPAERGYRKRSTAI